MNDKSYKISLSVFIERQMGDLRTIQTCNLRVCVFRAGIVSTVLLLFCPVGSSVAV